MSSSLKELKKAVITTLLIVLVSTGAMAVTQLFMGKFEWSNIGVVVFAQLLVGVPIFYMIEKYSAKSKQKND